MLCCAQVLKQPLYDDMPKHLRASWRRRSTYLAGRCFAVTHGCHKASCHQTSSCRAIGMRWRSRLRPVGEADGDLGESQC